MFTRREKRPFVWRSKMMLTPQLVSQCSENSIFFRSCGRSSSFYLFGRPESTAAQTEIFRESKQTGGCSPQAPDTNRKERGKCQICINPGWLPDGYKNTSFAFHLVTTKS